MKDWNEGSIALVYYSGLFIALGLGILVVWFLKAKGPLTKVFNRGPLLLHSFRSTLITAGLLGAMTVSFTGCDCNCGELIGNPTETINLGIAQVKAAALTLAAVVSGWLMILIIAQQYSRSMHWKSFLASGLLFLSIAMSIILVWTVTYTVK